MSETTMLDAGKKLDARIDEALFGHRVEWFGGLPFRLDILGPARFPDPVAAIHHARALVPDYSTDIADAWLVMEKLRGRGVYLTVIATADCYNVTDVYERDVFQEDTAPLAICRAALAALGA